jgi:S-adenosylmethionine:tRNA ribosyltransferase-isomerase
MPDRAVYAIVSLGSMALRMQRTDFHYDLPQELIAQRPVTPRSASRLLALDGGAGSWRDLRFGDLPGLLTSADLLVFNDTRVIPARIHGTKESGGRVELLLERVLTADTALMHARASKGLRLNARVNLPGGHSAHMLGRVGDLYRLKFSGDVLAFFEAHGDVPLPPYIDRAPESADRERYQCVFARALGAVAAPTAGLHFDGDIFAALENRRVKHAFVTLHVGAGTFQPLRVDDIEGHEMHAEYLEVPQSTGDAINFARAAGGRVIAVGTTVVRRLETAAGGGAISPYRGLTRIFIKPGYRFRAVDAMVTNFHLPESTLLMLCAAFVGKDALLAAYEHAIEDRYRFFSYGDAMFLTPAAAALERA